MGTYFYSTIFIYTLTFISLYFSCLLAKNKRNWKYAFIGIAIYAIIFGCRYGVGVDFFSYLSDYEQARNLMLSNNINYEVGFAFIMTILADFYLHPAFFFGLIAFLQLFLIFRSVRKDTWIYTYLAFTFVIGCVWLNFSNGLRQELAFCIFALALSYTDKKQIYAHYALILLAMSMHTSAFLMVIFFPILLYSQEWFKNEKIQLVILAIAFIFGQSGIFENYLSVFETLLEFDTYTNYDTYLRYEDKLYSEVSIGLGFYITLLINFITVAFSSKAKKMLDNKNFTIMYNFYFIGTILRYAFLQSHLIQRVNYYFYGFHFIITAYIIYYLYKNKMQKTLLLMISLYLLTFIATMLKMEGNTAMFRFYWDIIQY